MAARYPRFLLLLPVFLLVSANVASGQEFASDPFGRGQQLGGGDDTASIDSSQSLGGSGGGGGGLGGLLGGGGGCSSNYWAQHPNSWPNLLNIYTSVTQVLGQLAYSIFGGPTTLLGALQNQSNDPYSSLLREATAALLNSYAHPSSFQFSTSAVRQAFQSSLRSPQSAAYQAALFRRANSGGFSAAIDSSCS